MELKKELLEFLEANNLFGLEDMENAEGVIDSYLKVYKKQLTLTDVIVSDFCSCDGVQDLHTMTGECRKCGKECDY